MVSALDVNTNKLLTNVAGKLKEKGVTTPSFIGSVKTGAHNERLPEQDDFFYVRCASILRQTYIRNVVGVQRLRLHYGGKKNRGVKPNKSVRAGGSIIRKALQALENAGFIEKIEKGKIKGRKLTPQGRKLLDQCAKEIKRGDKGKLADLVRAKST
ncbi:MAG: 30S ribosomal protein S19e [Candidatus Micrarchaeota archaeon]